MYHKRDFSSSRTRISHEILVWDHTWDLRWDFSVGVITTFLTKWLGYRNISLGWYILNYFRLVNLLFTCSTKTIIFFPYKKIKTDRKGPGAIIRKRRPIASTSPDTVILYIQVIILSLKRASLKKHAGMIRETQFIRHTAAYREALYGNWVRCLPRVLAPLQFGVMRSDIVATSQGRETLSRLIYTRDFVFYYFFFFWGRLGGSSRQKFGRKFAV